MRWSLDENDDTRHFYTEGDCHPMVRTRSSMSAGVLMASILLLLTSFALLSGVALADNPEPFLEVTDDYEKRGAFIPMSATRTYMANVSDGNSVEFILSVTNGDDDGMYHMDVLVNNTRRWESAMAKGKSPPVLSEFYVTDFELAFNGPSDIYVTIHNSDAECPPYTCSTPEGPVNYDIKIVYSDVAVLERPDIIPNLDPFVITVIAGIFAGIIALNWKAGDN